MKIHSPSTTKVSQPSLRREDLCDDESDGGTSALGMDANLVTSPRDPLTLSAAVANLRDSLRHLPGALLRWIRAAPWTLIQCWFVRFCD